MGFFYWLRKIILYKILSLKTYGVRIAVFYGDKVLLVRHRAHHLWVFPGGGIKSSEEPKNAAAREFYEETGFIINNSADFSQPYTDRLKFFNKFENNSSGKNDIVYLFTIDLDKNKKPLSLQKFIFPPKRNFLDFLEIAETRWFQISNLPKNISTSTRQRILEIKNHHLPISKIW
jgi:8-oxo-dGTP pyrophosphatase MutT (NUDIX family)